MPRGCTRILLARLRSSGRPQLGRAAPAVSRANSKRPASHRAPSARRGMAEPGPRLRQWLHRSRAPRCQLFNEAGPWGRSLRSRPCPPRPGAPPPAPPPASPLPSRNPPRSIARSRGFWSGDPTSCTFAFLPLVGTRGHHREARSLALPLHCHRLWANEGLLGLRASLCKGKGGDEDAAPHPCHTGLSARQRAASTGGAPSVVGTLTRVLCSVLALTR